jgi:hypothetical protein
MFSSINRVDMSSICFNFFIEPNDLAKKRGVFDAPIFQTTTNIQQETDVSFDTIRPMFF